MDAAPHVSLRRWWTVLTAIAAACCAAVSCSNGDAGSGSSVASTAAGNYATTPILRASAKVATEQEARLAEAIRLADALVDPVEINPSYLDRIPSMSYIASDGSKLVSLLDGEAAASLRGLGLLASASSGRQSREGGRELAVSVWELPSARAAQEAVEIGLDTTGSFYSSRGVAGADRTMESVSATQVFAHAARAIGTLVLWTASTVSRGTAPDIAAMSSFFDRQSAALQAFTPQGAADYTAVSAPTSELQTQVLPVTSPTKLAILNATYSRRGGLHWQNDGSIVDAFKRANVSEIAMGLSNGYRTGSPSAANDLAIALLVSNAGGERAVDYLAPRTVSGPGLRCRKLEAITSSTNGAAYWCTLVVANRVYEVGSQHHQDLWQQVAAQRILAKSGP